MTDPDAHTCRKRRGVVRASITRLVTRLKDLEGKADQPNTIDLAQRMKQRLENLDSDFKVHHSALIDVLDDADDLQKEQDTLDEHDEETSLLAVRIQQLITHCTIPSDSGPRKIASRKLSHLRKSLASISEKIGALSTHDDICLISQYQEHLSDFKGELRDVRGSLLSMDLEEEDDLFALQSGLEKTLFECSLDVKRSLQSRSEEPRKATPLDGSGVKLPKLDVPTFDGNLVNWKSFWEQFSISVHDRPKLSDSEKLVYLQQSLKGGSAKHTVEGLSRSGEQYSEAIECLKCRYDRPRLIHQTHVRTILEAPSLKEGSGRELRRLHDTVQQHLRALKAMEYEPSGPFITSMLELKLDTNTMFEWQKHSQDSSKVPHYRELLEFVNLRAQASETSVSDHSKRPPKTEGHFAKGHLTSSKSVASFTASTSDNTASACILCKTEKHPLYYCPKFKSSTHDQMISTLKANGVCMNCLRPGHYLKQCKSLHRCRVCQKPHHTLLHLEAGSPPVPVPALESTVEPIPSHAATGLNSNSLLMTCRVLVDAPDGSSVEARAILDCASSASFISERLTQSLCLPRSHQGAIISGVAGLSQKSPLQSVTRFNVSGVQLPSNKFIVTAIVVPRVTCDLPLQLIPIDPKWNHLSDIRLADPSFAQPGRIDVLLGVDVFVEVLLHGRRIGPPNSPTAFETKFGWVLAGKADVGSPASLVATHQVSLISGDDILRKFWEIEENPANSPALSPEERSVVRHYRDNHSRTESGRFIVPLPKKPDVKALGESRSQAVRRFLSLERSLRARSQFDEFSVAMEEYFEMGHAELVPVADLQKPHPKVFYLPMQAVRKESSSTTKVRVVFDASAESSSGVSLNDKLLVGPTVHAPLIDVLIRFRLHRVALTTDVSRMYRAVELADSDRDLHRFVWRKDPGEILQDYRMTRITFGISASSFAANMSVKQNALDLALEYPMAAKVVDESFYVDDGLTGADSVEEAIRLQVQLQSLFSRAGFLLRKWNSSEPTVLQHLSPDLKDTMSMHTIPDPDEYTKTLGIEWNAVMDHFRLTVAELPSLDAITKRVLVSDVAKTFDVLGWFSPSTIKVKILMQRLWEMKVDWDDPVPIPVRDVWLQWRSELKLLSSKHIPRCYFPKGVHITSLQLHGFSDASECAYAGVVYLRMEDSNGNIHVSMVTSKTRVAPIKRLTIPRLELCGAHLLAQLLHHVKEVFHLSLCDVFAWTDSTIVLSWLVGSPRRFKTYVGNRVSFIMERIAPDRWSHVSGLENPADCASRGLLPSELLQHELWWDGPRWLWSQPSTWPNKSSLPLAEPSDEEREISLHTSVQPMVTVIPLDRYSSFAQLKRATAWVLRFVNNCRSSKRSQDKLTSTCLSVEELIAAERYWVLKAQDDLFAQEIETIKKNSVLPSASSLLPLHPFVDSSGLLRVGGRESNSERSYSKQHPVILHGKHPVTKLVIQSEHLRLLHAGPTLLSSSLGRRFHIVGCRKAVHSITRGCTVCRRHSTRPRPQMLGQLPIERVTPGPIFDKVGVDYAGPIYIKHGFVRKPTVVKAYICIFVSLSVKAVHLELASDMTTDAFIACLRRFTARRGLPSLIWSDHGSNFVGATREMKEFVAFLEQQKTQKVISDFCSSQNIEWKFIPEHAPHFGGLWEAAVKSVKTHLRRVTTNVKLTFEEFTTLLTQVEACLNSRPLASLPRDDDGMEALTPGHFLIGRPLEAIPDPSFSYRSVALLRRWHLCQNLVRHFWNRWSAEYLATLRRFAKWHHPSNNIRVGDVVILQEDGLVPTKWPLARVTEVYPGRDGLVRVVTVQTHAGTYKRPVTKIAPLLTVEN